MSASDQGGPAAAPAADTWYAQSPEDVAKRFAVDPAAGLSAAKAADLLKQNGPNALPAEKRKPGWQRFIDEYRSYMQIILLVCAVASLVIGQFQTGALVVVLTVLNLSLIHI